jgi:hypothetical protein
VCTNVCRCESSCGLLNFLWRSFGSISALTATARLLFSVSTVRLSSTEYMASSSSQLRNNDPLCYQFQLGKNHSLNISESSITALNLFILKSGFHHITALRVSSIFSELSNDGLLTKQQFDHGVEKLWSSYHSQNQRMECSFTLSSIFYTFDRSGSGVVDVIDLICGLSVLCEGFVTSSSFPHSDPLFSALCSPHSCSPLPPSIQIKKYEASLCLRPHGRGPRRHLDQTRIMEIFPCLLSFFNDNCWWCFIEY